MHGFLRRQVLGELHEGRVVFCGECPAQAVQIYVLVVGEALGSETPTCGVACFNRDCET